MSILDTQAQAQLSIDRRVDVVGKPLRDMTDLEACQWVIQNYEEALIDKQAAILRNKRYDEVFQALDPEELRVDPSTEHLEEDESLHANSYIPAVAARIDTSAAQTWNATFSVPDYITGQGQSDFDDLAIKTKIIPHMRETHRQINFKYTVFKAILGSKCFDYAITEGFWQLEPGFIPKTEVMNQMVDLGRLNVPNRSIKTEMKWIPDKYDRYNVRYVPFKQCLHDPQSNGLEDSSYFFIYRWVPLGVLEAMEQTDWRPFGRYKNIDKIKKIVADSVSKQKFFDSDTPEIEATVNRNRVKVITGYTANHVVMYCCGYIIHRRDLFDWPIHIWKDQEKGGFEGKFEGIGMTQRTERMQIDINSAVSDRQNFWNRLIDPPFFYDEALADQTDGVIRNGQGYMVPKNSNKSPKDMVEFMKIGSTPPNGAMAELQLELQVLKEITGVDANTLGLYSAGRRTAYESGQVNQGAASRFGVVAERHEDVAIERIYAQQFLYNQLYMTKKERFKHMGEQGWYSVITTPEDYRMTGGVSFFPRGTSNVRDEVVHIQQLMTFADRAMNFPQFVNMPQLFLMIGKALLPRDYHKLVKDPTQDAHNIPPSIENQIFAMGQEVDVSPANDHQKHAKVHELYINSADFQAWPQAFQAKLLAHKAKHDQEVMNMAAKNLGGDTSRARSNTLTGGPGGMSSIAQGNKTPAIGVTP